MADVVEQLRALDSTFAELLTISCAPALSLGVLHHGEIIHTAHFGRRDPLYDTPPDDETIYHIASLTKALTSSAVALLVEEGTLDWDTPIREYLPTFSRRTDEIGQKTTLKDLLSHRTGLPNADFIFGQQNGEFLMPRSEIVRTTTFFEAVRPFREKFFYSQWNYGLVTEVIEAVTGTTLGSYIKDKILDPLGMSRTTLGRLDDENIVAGYAPRNDGTPCKLTFPDMTDGVGLAGGFAGKSSVKDLLLLYQSLLRARQDQLETKLHRTPGMPFTHTDTIFTPHISVGTSAETLAYCLGLYRTRLPGPLSVASINSGLLGSRKLPIIGKTSPGLEIFHHTGNIPGFVASAFLVPLTQSGVVVLANALPFMDPTDLVGQLSLSVLIGQELETNFVPLAKLARANGLGAYAALTAAVNEHKSTEPPRFPLQTYEGCYWNVAGNFCLEITVCGTTDGVGLLMKVQDSPKNVYRLEPYNRDTFYWPPDREKELCEQGMWINIRASLHEIAFGTSEDGQSISHLTWHHDAAARPETFQKRTPHSQQCRL